MAKTIAATDPAAAAATLWPSPGRVVGDPTGGVPIEDGGTAGDGPDMGGAGGELAGEEVGVVEIVGAEAGTEVGVAAGGVALEEGVGAGAEALGGGDEAGGGLVGETVGADDGA